MFYLQILIEEDSEDNNLQPPVIDTNDQSEIHSQKQATEPLIQTDSQSNEVNSLTKQQLFVSPKNKNLKRKMDIEDKKRLTKAYEIIDNISSAPAPRDECLVYGEHVSNKLRKFNEHRRAILMHKINNLIFEAEMELYHSQQGFSYKNIYSSSSASSVVSTPQSSPFPQQSSTPQPVPVYTDETATPHNHYETLQNFVTNFTV